ncbi:hypothetical protein, partial [Actinomadura sp. 7K507]|uniref:hypothetical protein n=1 Tax=Actinomadura sp. 7K507 TaxID=2530365 RepID=UPI001A9F2428
MQMVFWAVPGRVQVDVQAADLVDRERDQLVRIITVIPFTVRLSLPLRPPCVASSSRSTPWSWWWPCRSGGGLGG